MEKNIKDYLHLYLPYGISVFVFPDESITDGFLDKYRQDYPNGIFNPILTFDNYKRFIADGYKPILRPLSDMTEEEMKELYDKNFLYGNSSHSSEVNNIGFTKTNFNCIEISYSGNRGSGYTSGMDLIYLNKLSAEQFLFLLSKHFDLFGLIESGLGIDKTKLIQPA